MKTVSDILDDNGTAFVLCDEEATAYGESIVLGEEWNLELQTHLTGEIRTTFLL